MPAGKLNSHHLSHTLYQHLPFPGIYLIRSDAQMPRRDTGNKKKSTILEYQLRVSAEYPKVPGKIFHQPVFFLINTFYRPVRKPYWPTPMAYVRTLSPLHIPGVPCGVILSPDPWK